MFYVYKNKQQVHSKNIQKNLVSITSTNFQFHVTNLPLNNIKMERLINDLVRKQIQDKISKENSILIPFVKHKNE